MANFARNTFYFDGSDAAATDPNNVWTNEANIFDYDLAPSTYATSPNSGSVSSNFAKAEGTNAFSSGGTIEYVKARIYGGTNNNHAWGSYVTLATPSGGWTWAKVQALEVKVYHDAPIDITWVFAAIYTDSLGELLGTAEYASSTGSSRVYKVEIEVTHAKNDETFADFYIGSPSVSSPTVTTAAATNPETTTAIGWGAVTDDGDGAVTERGFVWDLESNADPTTGTNAGKLVVAGSTGSFTGTMTKLEPNILYTYRAYAINSAGTSYGAATNFTSANYKTFMASAVMYATGGGTVSLILYNKTDSTEIAASEMSTSNWYPTLLTREFAYDATNFVDAKNYEYRIRTTTGATAQIVSAQLFIRLKNLTKATSYNRLSRFGFTALSADAAVTTARYLYESASYSSPVIDWEVTGTEDTNGTNELALYDVTTTDSGTTGSEVAGTQIDVNSTVKTRSRVSAISLTNNNRYIGLFDWTSGGARYHQGILAIEASGAANTVDIASMVELLDIPRSSVLGTTYDPKASHTPFRTTNYDGATYYFETVATNSHATNTYDVKLIAVNKDGTETDVITQTLTANTGSSNVRYRTGSATIPTDTVYVKVRLPSTAAAKNVVLGSARIIVKQVNATKTVLQIPMGGGNTEWNHDVTNPMVTTTQTTYNLLATNVDQFTIWPRTDAEFDKYFELSGLQTVTISHTTSANKRVTGDTRTHTTDANRKVSGNTRTHTTDALKRKATTVTHTTDANRKKSTTVTHTADANKRLATTRTHTTDANKRVTGLTRTHTTDSLLRKQFTLTHTTDANKRKATTVVHTADANKRLATIIVHTTDSLKRKQLTLVHTTDANRKKATTVSHTTDSLLRKQNTRTHTTDANKRLATTRAHTTDSNKRKATTVFHTTDANKRTTGLTRSHATDSLLRRQLTRTHTTDSNKRLATLTTHTTDALRRKANTLLHTTDSFLRKAQTVTHTTDANKRKATVVAHSTDSNKRKATTVPHTTDANLRKATIVSHTTDSNKRKLFTLTHTTDSNKKKSGVLRTHTTDTNLVPSVNLDQFQPHYQFTTNFGYASVKQVAQEFVPGTSGRLDKIITTIYNAFEATDAVFIKIYSNNAGEPGTLLATSTNSFDGSTHPWADPITTFAFEFDNSLIIVNGTSYWMAFERSGALDGGNTFIVRQSSGDPYPAGATRYLNPSDVWADLGDDLQFYQYTLVPATDTKTHSTDSFKRKANTISHSTGSFLRKAQTVSHTTSSNKKKADNTVTHTTDSNKRKTNTLSHTTDSRLSVGIQTVDIVHSTDSLLRKTNTRTHSTDSFVRKTNILAHSTDSNKRKATLVSHTADANKRKATVLTHTTDSNKRVANITRTHTTDSLLRTQNTRTHSTDALRRSRSTLTHTTDALIRKTNIAAHTTDSNKKRSYAVAHSTDSNKRKAGNIVTHTTDALKRTLNTLAHTADSLKRKATTLVHTTDSFLRKTNTRVHTTDANKKAAGNTRTHTTDANKRKVSTVSHTTDSQILKATETAVYYFNASDSGPTGSATNPSQAFNASNTDAASNIGIPPAYLVGGGTTAPTTGNTITQVRARMKAGSSQLFGGLGEVWTQGLGEQLGTAFASDHAFGSWTTLSVPSGGWTWQKANDLVVRFAYDEKNAGSGSSATVYIGEIEVTYNVNAPQTRTHTTDANKRKVTTLTHTTDSNKKKTTVATHSTDSFLRKTNTVVHTTDSNKKKQTTSTHTTDANKRLVTTRTHTTDSYLRETEHAKLTQRIEMARSASNTSGTANTYIEIPYISTKLNTADFDGDVTYYFETAFRNGGSAGQTAYVELWNKTDGVSVSGSEVTEVGPTPNGFPRRHRVPVVLSGDKVYTIRVKHSNTTTNTVVGSARIIVVQTGDITKTQIHQELGIEGGTTSTSNTNRLTGAMKFLYESAKYDGTVTVRHDAVVRTTASNSVTSGIYDETAAGILSGSEVSKTNDTNYTVLSSGNLTLTDGHIYQPTAYVSAGASVLFESNKLVFTITGGFSKYLAYVAVDSGSTTGHGNSTSIYPNYNVFVDYVQNWDATDFAGANILTAYEAMISINNAAQTVYGNLQTYDYDDVTANNVDGSEISRTGSTTPDRVRSSYFSPIPTNDLSNGTASTSGTNSARTYNGYIVLEVNQFNEITNVLTHTTDALRRKATAVVHTTDSLKRKTNNLSHTTDSFLRRAVAVTHTTDSFLRKASTLVHTTDSNKRKVSTASHTTDANKRKTTLASHTTDALKRTLNTISHTTDAFLRRAIALTHTTDALQRKAETIVHTGDANKRKATTTSHTTDSLKESIIAVSHTTDSLKRSLNTRTHTTDSLKRKANTRTHTTDAQLLELNAVIHTTDTHITYDDYSREDKTTLPTTDATLATRYNGSERSDVATNDNTTYVPQAGFDYLIHEFKHKHSTNNSTITPICNLKTTLATTTSTVYLQIFNQDSGLWETIDSENTVAANTDFTLTATISVNLTDYYTADKWVTCRVYQEVV